MTQRNKLADCKYKLAFLLNKEKKRIIQSLYLKSSLSTWPNRGFEAKGEIVFEDVSEGVISEAIYERAQTLRENDKTYKEDILKINGHGRIYLPQAIGVYHIKQSRHETQAQLKQMQQHCFVGLIGLTDIRRDGLHSKHDSNICIHDNHAHQYKKHNDKGLV